MEDAPLPQQVQNATGNVGEPMEEETLHAVSVDRELIPLQKAQTLSKANKSLLLHLPILLFVGMICI